MKPSKFFLCILALLLTQVVIGQTLKTSGTTIEEYNYLTKGYKSQVIDQGGDIKKGYELRDLSSYDISGRHITYKEFVKDGKDLRALLAIFTGKDGTTQYIGIPLGNVAQNVSDAYYSIIPVVINNADALNFYQYTLTKLLSSYIVK